MIKVLIEAFSAHYKIGKSLKGMQTYARYYKYMVKKQDTIFAL